MKQISLVLTVIGTLVLTACQSTKPTPPPSTTKQNTPAIYRTPSGTIINPSSQPIIHTQRPSTQPIAQPVIQAVAIPQSLKKVWQLTTITGTDNDEKYNQILAKNPITIDLSNAPKGVALTGCNTMTFNIRLAEGNRFGFGNVNTSKKLCFDIMSLELALAKYVKSTRHYQLDDNSLLLYGQTVQMHLHPIQSP